MPSSESSSSSTAGFMTNAGPALFCSGPVEDMMVSYLDSSMIGTEFVMFQSCSEFGVVHLMWIAMIQLSTPST